MIGFIPATLSGIGLYISLGIATDEAFAAIALACAEASAWPSS